MEGSCQDNKYALPMEEFTPTNNLKSFGLLLLPLVLQHGTNVPKCSGRTVPFSHLPRPWLTHLRGNGTASGTFSGEAGATPLGQRVCLRASGFIGGGRSGCR